MTRLAASCFALGLVASIVVPAAHVQNPVNEHPRGYVAYRAASSIVVDGKLTESTWLSANWTEPFVDIEGEVRRPPAHLTRVKMAWDDANFYIGAMLTEPHLWATLEAHDSVIFRDNDFEVFIDPNGDNHEYYELEINALNTTWDLFLPKPYKDDGKAVNGWEIAGMKTAVNLDGTLNDPSDADRGWTVEIALPWKALGELARRPSPPQNGDQWRINFSRVQWQLNGANGRYEKVPNRREDNWVWSPQGVIDMHRPERWGYVQFASTTSGPVSFVRDPSAQARDFLHAVYYAQREFRRGNKRWARTLAELEGLLPPPGTWSDALSEANLVVAGEQFQADVTLWVRVGFERSHIRQDSLIWKD
jgi:hypothetical protein